ncbi:hypothetical protein AVEN_228661-1 [Araneus ventricosus]|uniref:Uncharacterized protein n=1 Tax=Araneus ventricosus TaxID=182803 RepID=A0A4Y2P6F2_ARAVE|nr:hypothetical protein AVEN_228661-1 [Araneus ventricosus]
MFTLLDIQNMKNSSLTSVQYPDQSKILEVDFTSSPSAARKRNNSSSSLSTISSFSDNAGPFSPTHNHNPSFIKLLESLKIIVNRQTVPKKSSTIPKPHFPVSWQNSILDQLETQGKTFATKQQTNQSTTEIQVYQTANRNGIKHLIQLTSITANHPSTSLAAEKIPKSIHHICRSQQETTSKQKNPTLLLYPMKSAEKEVLEILKREIARPSTKIKDVQKIRNKDVAVQLERDQELTRTLRSLFKLLRIKKRSSP